MPRFERQVGEVRYVMEPERHDSGASLGESYAGDKVHKLPVNWQDLEWYRLWDSPCLSGGDSYVALDEAKHLTYAVFDNWTNVWHCDGGLEQVFEDNLAILTGTADADEYYDRPHAEVETVDVEFDKEGLPS